MSIVDFGLLRRLLFVKYNGLSFLYRGASTQVVLFYVAILHALGLFGLSKLCTYMVTSPHTSHVCAQLNPIHPVLPPECMESGGDNL